MLNDEDKKFLELYSDSEYEKPSVTVDSVIFRLNSKPQDNYRKLPEKKLQVLLLKREYPPFKGKYSIPGTFIDLNYELSQSMRLCVERKVGLKDFYHEQLFTFGEKSRDPRTRVISTSFLLLTNSEIEVSDGKWFDVELIEGQVSSPSKFKQKKDIVLLLKSEDEIYSNKIVVTQDISPTGQTKEVNLVESELAFDHAKIIFYGLERLKNKLEYTDVIFNLLPEKFTLTELKLCYETILQTKLLDANFRRKIIDRLSPIEEFEEGMGHRKSQYFTRKNILDIHNLE